MNTTANLNLVVTHSNKTQTINSGATGDNVSVVAQTRQQQSSSPSSSPNNTTTTPTTTPATNTSIKNNNSATTTTTTTTTSSSTAYANAGAGAGSASHNNNTTNNGSLPDSRASTEGHRTPNVDHLSKTNLYIRGLQANTSDQDLVNMCNRFGEISSTKAILDKASGCCRGYGFVEFKSPQSAGFAVQELTKSGIQAQMAKVSPLYSSHNHHHNHHQQQHHHHHHHQHHHHQQQQHHNLSNNHTNNSNSGNSNITSSSSSVNNNNNNNNGGQQHNQNSLNNNADPTNLYIANLPPNMSEQELENLLSTYGPVVSTRILRDHSNIPRGVGFARMNSRDECEQIIEQLNGRPYKGWKEPLLVKFADGGNKKRHHHNNHQYQHHNNNLQHHKVHQDDSRWRDSSNTSDLGSVSSFDHQSNIPLSNHLSDLAMMNSMGYPRIQHGYPPTVTTGATYPTPLGPPTSAPQWIHPGPGQPYVIPQQMIQAGSLGPSNQAAALHYGHIPQLTSQMHGLQLAHPGAPVSGYLPPQPHQWSTLWTHPIPQQPPPQPSMRLTTPMQPHPPPAQQQSPQSPVQQIQQQQPSTPQQQPLATDNKLQVTMPQ